MDKVALIFDSMCSAWMALMNLIGLFMSYVYESKYRVYALSLSMVAICLLHLKTCSIMLIDFVVPAMRNPSAFYPSPINIVTSRVYRVCQTRLDQLEWINYGAAPRAVFMQNNGSSVVMHMSSAPNCVPYICGGLLPGNYYFAEATFKWGGSEHLIDSRRFSLEMQVLHATNIPNAPFEYLTISYLFVTTRHKSHALQQVIENLGAIVNAGSIIELPSFDLPSLFWPFNSGFYSYSGTYTNGTIMLPTQWLICTSIFYVSEEQLNQFKLIRNPDSLHIAGNARAERPVGHRRVYLNEFN